MPRYLAGHTHPGVQAMVRSHASELGITMLAFAEVEYVPATGEWRARLSRSLILRSRLWHVDTSRLISRRASSHTSLLRLPR